MGGAGHWGLGLIGIAAFALPAGAGASFPGDNGDIVFQNDTLGGIYSIHMDGSERDRLADGFEPSWAASGKRIIYVDHPAPSGLDDTEIYTMKANGKDKHRITHDNISQWEPVFSPDAKQIAYRTGKFRSTMGKLYVADADGTHRKEIGRGEDPDWSIGVEGAKDGLIAYAGEPIGPCLNAPEILTVKPNGNATTGLPFDCELSFGPSWSPDGAKLAFASTYPSNGDIYIGPDDGSSRTLVANIANKDDDPAWSPDALRIAFNDEDNGLWFVSVSSPNQETQITNTADVDAAKPAWQPK